MSADCCSAKSTTAGPFYHGTPRRPRRGDLLAPGFTSNYAERQPSWIYFSSRR